MSSRRFLMPHVSLSFPSCRGIYGANFREYKRLCTAYGWFSLCLPEPTDINPAPLTHILYSFADTSADTGAIFLTDSYADQEVRFRLQVMSTPVADGSIAQKRFPGDTWDEPGNNLYGCLKQVCCY